MTASHGSGYRVVEHALVKAKVAVLRDKDTPLDVFRRTLRELTALVAFEATRDLELDAIELATPLERCAGHRLSRPIVVVPILRAGLGMAEAMLAVLPEARVGHVGMCRDEHTFLPRSYYFKAPDLAEAEVFLVDPMMATGHSACDAMTELKACGAKRIRMVALVGCVIGLKHFQHHHPDVPVYMAALDDRLDERAYIRPGLGDAGDRYFGT